MPRPFPILATVAGLLSLASLAAGVVALPGPHRGLAILATAATIGAHGSVAAYFAATGRRVDATAARLGLADWLGAQAEKNRRKAFAYQAWGVPLALLAGWSAGSGGGEAWRHALPAASLAFQVGAFAGEYAVIVAQARLVRDLGGPDGGGISPRPAADP